MPPRPVTALTVVEPLSRFDERRQQAARRATLETAVILSGEAFDRARRAADVFRAALTKGEPELGQMVQAARDDVAKAHAALAEILEEFRDGQ